MKSSVKKSVYPFQQFFLPGSFVIIQFIIDVDMDIRNSNISGFIWPFEPLFTICMKEIIRQKPNILLAYTYHNEIFFVLHPARKTNNCQISDILTSILSNFLFTFLSQFPLIYNITLIRAPHIQTQMFLLPQIQNIFEYLKNKSNYCHRLSLEFACLWIKPLFDKKTLSQQSISQLNEILFKEHINYNNLPNSFKKGIIVTSNTFPIEYDYDIQTISPFIIHLDQ